MKKIIIISILLINCSWLLADLYLIDTIEAVTFAPEGTEIIARSDIERPSLAGQVRSRDDIIFERLVFLDARKYKIMPDEDAVDKYLAMVQRENNLTLDDLKAIFNAAGYSYEEGREQFKMMQAINSMLDFKIRQNLLVPRKQVEKYFEEHPEWQEATYSLAYAAVPFSAIKDKEQQKAELKELIKIGTDMRSIEWNEPFWVNHSDVAEDKSFIFTMKPSEVFMHETDQGFGLFRLEDKKERRLLTMDERYLDIADILRRPKYEELLQNYKDHLFNTASIIYF